MNCPEPSRVRQLILPDGCVDLILDLRRCRAFIVGTMTVAQEITFREPTELVAIRFAPGGAFPVLGLPLCELTDRQVEFGDLRRDADEILQAVRGLGARRAAAALQRQLAARPLAGPAPAAHWQAAIAALTSGTRVGDLSRQLGLSRQHLNRRCRELVGIGPKRLSRIARLRRLLRIVSGEGTDDWAGAALAAGYYDQAHMIGDVKALTGRTPGRLGAPAGA